MANYSRVTNKDGYCKVVAKPGKQGEVAKATGWYVGGVVKTGEKYKNKQFTAHLLRPSGEIIGVNFTPGNTKQYLNGQLVLSDLLGRYVEIGAGEVIMTERGPFQTLEIKELPAPSEMPRTDIKLVHFVDLDQVKGGAGLYKKPSAGNVAAEDVEDYISGEDESTETLASTASVQNAKASFNANPFAD